MRRTVGGCLLLLALASSSSICAPIPIERTRRIRLAGSLDFDKYVVGKATDSS